MLSEDQKAIEQVLAGDTSAYAHFVEKYQRRLLGLLLHACGNRELAEDISQETLARAYQKLKLFSGESQFFTWLARIGLNLLASDRRRKRIENQLAREGMDVAMDSIGTNATAEGIVELTETQATVRQAIQLLDSDRRNVLILRDFDGMDYEAISDTLEIPVGTVRSRLHRARLELKDILLGQAVQLGLSEA